MIQHLIYSTKYSKIKKRWLSTTKYTQQNQLTPFNIEGIDYPKLIQSFGCQQITKHHINRIQALIGQKPHHLLTRGIYFAHRDLDLILNRYQQGLPFYLYTGRGPSSPSMHLGHLIPFIFNKYLQQTFKVPLVIQISDDQKYTYRPELQLSTVQHFARQNIKDIIACGFDINKTFIFTDTQYIKYLYPNFLKMQKHITLNQILGCFGFNKSDNIGKFSYPPMQAVPAFCSTFPHIFGDRTDIPCLIPEAIDQDPYFRITRDVAPRIQFQKPAVLHAKFFPALQGQTAKMSSSVWNSAIWLTDNPEEIQEKIKKHAFSGGGKTLKEQREQGANLQIDVPFQWLQFFMQDDQKLAQIATAYSKGQILTSEVKKILIDLLQKLLKTHQQNRAKITENTIEEFMKIRPLKF